MYHCKIDNAALSQVQLLQFVFILKMKLKKAEMGDTERSHISRF